MKNYQLPTREEMRPNNEVVLQQNLMLGADLCKAPGCLLAKDGNDTAGISLAVVKRSQKPPGAEMQFNIFQTADI